MCTPAVETTVPFDRPIILHFVLLFLCFSPLPCDSCACACAGDREGGGGGAGMSATLRCSPPDGGCWWCSGSRTSEHQVAPEWTTDDPQPADAQTGRAAALFDDETSGRRARCSPVPSMDLIRSRNFELLARAILISSLVAIHGEWPPLSLSLLYSPVFVYNVAE